MNVDCFVLIDNSSNEFLSMLFASLIYRMSLLAPLNLDDASAEKNSTFELPIVNSLSLSNMLSMLN